MLLAHSHLALALALGTQAVLGVVRELLGGLELLRQGLHLGGQGVVGFSVRVSDFIQVGLQLLIR